jgi:Na+-transporting methylmalonyl-CoA/oxaloacetate decarboxylase gamma subunit
MTTVVNNPAPQADTGGNGFLIGIIVFIGFVAIFLFFGIPALRRMGPVEVNAPAPQVNLPNKIDVNVNQTK